MNNNLALGTMWMLPVVSSVHAHAHARYDCDRDCDYDLRLRLLPVGN